jgi:hypothetical protein
VVCNGWVQGGYSSRSRVKARVALTGKDTTSRSQEVGVMICPALKSHAAREVVVAEDPRAFIPRSWSSCSRSIGTLSP